MEIHDYTSNKPKAVLVKEYGNLILMDCFKKGDPWKSTVTVSRKKDESHWHIHYMRTDCGHCDDSIEGESCGRIHGFRQQIAYERAYKIFAERNSLSYVNNEKFT